MDLNVTSVMNLQMPHHCIIFAKFFSLLILKIIIFKFKVIFEILIILAYHKILFLKKTPKCFWAGKNIAYII